MREKRRALGLILFTIMLILGWTTVKVHLSPVTKEDKAYNLISESIDIERVITIDNKITLIGTGRPRLQINENNTKYLTTGAISIQLNEDGSYKELWKYEKLGEEVCKTVYDEEKNIVYLLMALENDHKDSSVIFEYHIVALTADGNFLWDYYLGYNESNPNLMGIDSSGNLVVNYNYVRKNNTSDVLFLSGYGEISKKISVYERIHDAMFEDKNIIYSTSSKEKDVVKITKTDENFNTIWETELLPNYSCYYMWNGENDTTCAKISLKTNDKYLLWVNSESGELKKQIPFPRLGFFQMDGEPTTKGEYTYLPLITDISSDKSSCVVMRITTNGRSKVYKRFPARDDLPVDFITINDKLNLVTKTMDIHGRCEFLYVYDIA